MLENTEKNYTTILKIFLRLVIFSRYMKLGNAHFFGKMTCVETNHAV